MLRSIGSLTRCRPPNSVKKSMFTTLIRPTEVALKSSKVYATIRWWLHWHFRICPSVAAQVISKLDFKNQSDTKTSTDLSRDHIKQWKGLSFCSHIYLEQKWFCSAGDNSAEATANRDRLIRHTEGVIGSGSTTNVGCKACKRANASLNLNIVVPNKRVPLIARQIKELIESGRNEKTGVLYCRHSRGRLSKRKCLRIYIQLNI